jgi:sulfotransferase family protein
MHETPAPFIVGASRSGTTLLRLMLDSHPDLAIPPETEFILRLAELPGADATAFVDTLTSHRRWPDFHLDRALLEAQVATLQPWSTSDALRTFYRLYAERFAKPRWGDKTPGYVKHTRVVQDLLPEAHFIHIIRDGRDVAVSLIEEWRMSGRAMSVKRAAERWVSKIMVGREQARDLRHYLEVRYEDLVLDSESVLRQICDFVELRWHPVMLEYHHSAPERVAELVAPDASGTLNPAQRQAKHAWTSSPPEVSRIGRWRTEMSAEELAEYECAAGTLLLELGYAG